MSGGEDDLATAELVAFHVEGTAYYLVPLQLLDRFVVTGAADRPTPDSSTPDSSVPGSSARFGWGARVPEVSWNSFHDSQVGLLVDLAPGVTARLEQHHFGRSPIPSPSSSPVPSPTQGLTPHDRTEHP